MSRKVSIDIVGDSASAERAFLRTSNAARGFSRSTGIVEKDFSRMTRGVLSGSGVFTHLGRSLAFASGGFLAFGSAAEGIRKSIDAAEETEKAFRGLGAQARATRVDVASVFGKVEKLTGPALKLGFNKTDLVEGFTTLLRGSGSAAKAFREMGAAEDVARAKGLTLSQGAALVNRVLVSTGNAARSLGVHFPKAATQAQKLAVIMQRFAGQARAQTTEQDRFNATLFNTEQIVGATLLPTLNKYLASLGGWLQKMNESGRLEKDVSTITHDLATVFKDVTGTVRGVDRVTGSFTNTLKDLAAVWLILKARMAINWASTALGIESVGSAAAASTAEIGGLRGAFLALRSLPVITLTVELLVFKKLVDKYGTSASNAIQAGLNPFKTFGNDVAPDTIDPITGHPSGSPADQATLRRLRQTKASSQFGGISFGGIFAGVGKTISDAMAPVNADAAKAAATVKRSRSLLGQFNLLELKLADSERANNTILERSILVSEEKLLVELEAQAKTLKDRTGFAQQAAGVAAQIRAIDQSNLSTAKKAKKAAEAAAKKAASFTVPLSLQVDQARLTALGKPLTGILKRIKATAEKALKSGRLGLQGQLDAWNTIADVNNQLQNQATGVLGSFRQANVDKIAKSVGLAGAAAKKLKAELSQLGPGKTIPGTGVGAFGVIVGPHDTREFTLHNHVYIDGRQITSTVTKHQQKRKIRNPSQRRGAYAGGL